MNYYPNTYQTPNVLIDDLLKNGIIDAYEFTLLNVIIRKTRGWNKQKDSISLSQFIKLVPCISKRSIIYKLKSLESKKLVKIERRKIKKNNTTNKYSLGSIFNKKGSAPDAPGSATDAHTKPTLIKTKEDNSFSKNENEYMILDKTEKTGLPSGKFKKSDFKLFNPLVSNEALPPGATCEQFLANKFFKHYLQKTGFKHPPIHNEQMNSILTRLARLCAAQGDYGIDSGRLITKFFNLPAEKTNYNINHFAEWSNGLVDIIYGEDAKIEDLI